MDRDFPRGPVVESLPSNTEGLGLVPGQRTKISHAVQCRIRDGTRNMNTSVQKTIMPCLHQGMH